MNYEQFKALWVLALRESGLPGCAGDRLDESVDVRSMDRRCRAFVHVPSDRVATFNVSSELGFRWDALQTARTRSSEEDMVRELFGVDRSEYPRTELPRLRVDVILRASTLWGKEIPMPSNVVWRNWAHETLSRLENVEPLLPVEQVRENRRGMLEILAWKSEPELTVLCRPDGKLALRGVEIAAGQMINLPRKWDDSSRKQDQGPHDQIAALFRRLKAALHGWTEALDQLASTN